MATACLPCAPGRVSFLLCRDLQLAVLHHSVFGPVILREKIEAKRQQQQQQKHFSTLLVLHCTDAPISSLILVRECSPKKGAKSPNGHYISGHSGGIIADHSPSGEINPLQVDHLWIEHLRVDHIEIDNADSNLLLRDAAQDLSVCEYRSNPTKQNRCHIIEETHSSHGAT